MLARARGWFLDCERGKVDPVWSSEGEIRNCTPKIYIYLHLGDAVHPPCRADRCLQKEDRNRIRLAAYRQKVDMETHHDDCTFVAAVCTLRPASVSIILNGIVALAAVVTIFATLFNL